MQTAVELSAILGQNESGPSLDALIRGALEGAVGAPSYGLAYGLDDLAFLERALAHNLRNGRVYRVLKQQGIGEAELPPSLAAWLRASADEGVDACKDAERVRQLGQLVAYIRLMAEVYGAERERLAALSASEPEEWNTLCVQLTRQAYNQLMSHSVGSWFAHDKATELAQQACVRIFSATYPCDVSFDHWAGAILKNQVLEFLTRSTDLLDRNVRVDSIDQLDELGLEPSAPEPTRGEAPPELDQASLSLAFGDNEDLVAALHHIRSDERRAVLIMTYFHELDDGEIAARIGKSRGAVHTLRCRALTQLRSALTRMSDAEDDE